MNKKLIAVLVSSVGFCGQAYAAQQSVTQIGTLTGKNQLELQKAAVNTKLGVVESNRQDHETRVAALEALVGDRPWVAQATAPGDTTLLWFDTDQVADAVVLKIHNGTTWIPQAIGSSSGVQDLSGYALKANVLELANTTAFTPDADYEPATKKYVDDSITAGGGYTDEQAQDAVGGMFTGNTEIGISVTYDDSTGKVNFAVATQFDGTQNTTGSAAKLTTPRTIGGVSFDGSANINLPGVNAVGNQSTTGSAATLTTARTIGGTSFDGSANIDISYANLTNKPTIPSTLAALSDDSTHRLVTDVEKDIWNGKQAALGFTPENAAKKGTANGYAGLGSDGKVPTAQLPTLGTSQSATSLQMTFVSDNSLETQTGSKTKVPTGVDFTTADIGCDVSDSITFTLRKSSTVNGTYSTVGTISVSAAAQNESIDISSWANLTAGDWVRIDLTTAGTTAKECTVVIGGTEL